MRSFSVAIVFAAGSIQTASAALKTRFEAHKHLSTSVACQQEAHEVDADIAHPAKLGLIVHRKSGFVISKFAAECFDATRSQAHHMMDPRVSELDELLEENKNTKYVHLAREPLDLAVSNYLYNKFTSHEPGTLGKGTAKGALYRCNNHCEKEAFEQLPPYVDGESTREYLQRVDNRTGLLETLCETRGVIDSMMGHKHWCENNSDRCMQVYLNDLMTSSEVFTSTFKKIADFAGFEWTPELEDCLSYQDVNSANFGASHESHAGHCSMNHVSAAGRELIKADAQSYDADFMRSYYKKAAAELLRFPAA